MIPREHNLEIAACSMLRSTVSGLAMLWLYNLKSFGWVRVWSLVAVYSLVSETALKIRVIGSMYPSCPIFSAWKYNNQTSA